LIVLDTNVLVHIIRGKAAGRWIDSEFDLSQRPDRPLCSVVSVGELQHFAMRRNWGQGKTDALRDLLGNIVVIQLGARGIIESYATVGTYMEGIGRQMKQNDQWIAATAAATNAILLTTDTDFDELHPDYLERIYIDPMKLPRDR
jgi:tRNA(fMet)-specific endonuclease VapC